MRILVSGSSGHVGSIIASHLIENNHEVIGLSRRLNNTLNLGEYIQADISRTETIDKLLNEISPCQAIVHAAAKVNMDLYCSAISLTNCFGTQQLLKLASHWRVTNFIFISSVPVIGLPLNLPITEDHPTQPLTAYHASKLFGEHLVHLAERSGISVATLRLSSPVGYNMPDNRILSVFVQRALRNKPLQLIGHGSRKQNYVDVRDIAWVINECLRQNISGLFNVAANESISNQDLAELCINCLGSNSTIEFLGIPDPEEGFIWEVSIEKAFREIGYSPQYTLNDSIQAIASEHAD